MKTTIRGKRYDTATAKLLGSMQGGGSEGNPAFYEESLYRAARTGKHFLAGRGGPESRYAELGRDGWTGGEQIRVIELRTARAWAAQYLDPARAAELFPEGDEVAEP